MAIVYRKTSNKNDENSTSSDWEIQQKDRIIHKSQIEISKLQNIINNAIIKLRPATTD